MPYAIPTEPIPPAPSAEFDPGIWEIDGSRPFGPSDEVPPPGTLCQLGSVYNWGTSDNKYAAGGRRINQEKPVWVPQYAGPLGCIFFSNRHTGLRLLNSAIDLQNFHQDGKYDIYLSFSQGKINTTSITGQESVLLRNQSGASSMGLNLRVRESGLAYQLAGDGTSISSLNSSLIVEPGGAAVIRAWSDGVNSYISLNGGTPQSSPVTSSNFTPGRALFDYNVGTDLEAQSTSPSCWKLFKLSIHSEPQSDWAARIGEMIMELARARLPRKLVLIMGDSTGEGSGSDLDLASLWQFIFSQTESGRRNVIAWAMGGQTIGLSSSPSSNPGMIEVVDTYIKNRWDPSMDEGREFYLKEGINDIIRGDDLSTVFTAFQGVRNKMVASGWTPLVGTPAPAKGYATFSNFPAKVAVKAAYDAQIRAMGDPYVDVAEVLEDTQTADQLSYLGEGKPDVATFTLDQDDPNTRDFLHYGYQGVKLETDAVFQVKGWPMINFNRLATPLPEGAIVAPPDPIEFDDALLDPYTIKFVEPEDGYTDEAGTTPATADSSLIASIKDLDDSIFAVQSDSGVRPLLRTNKVLGRPMIQHPNDGVGKRLDATATLLNFFKGTNKPFTLLITYLREETNSAFRTFMAAADADAAGNVPVTHLSIISNGLYSQKAGDGNTGTFTVKGQGNKVMSTVIVVAYISTGTQMSMYISSTIPTALERPYQALSPLDAVDNVHIGGIKRQTFVSPFVGCWGTLAISPFEIPTNIFPRIMKKMELNWGIG